MAKRRIQQNSQMTGLAEPFNTGQSWQESLNQYMDMLFKPPAEEGIDDLSGTAQTPQQPVDVRYPQIPQIPGYEDEGMVDDTQGIPEGIELLGDLVSAEAGEDSLDAMSETMPPVEPEISAISEEIADNVPLPTEQEVMIPEEVPQEVVPQPSIESEVPMAVQEAIERGPVDQITEDDIPTEGLEPMQGAVERAEADPSIVNTVTNLMNLKEGDIPQEIWDHAKTMEGLLTKREEELTDLEQQYMSRLQNGEMTTMDKVALGVALAVPVIMGLTYGKEALMSSFGGAMQGLGTALLKQDEKQKSILSKIGDIQKAKGEIGAKKAAIKEEIVKNIENPAMRKLMKNYDIINIDQNPDGSVKISTGKDAAVFADRLGISARDEDRALWYDADLLRDDQDISKLKDAEKTGRIAIGKMKDANQTIDGVVEIMSAIKEQQPSLWKTLLQNFQPAMISDNQSIINYARKAIPQSDKALTIDIVGEDGSAKKVQALPLLLQRITALQDVYNKEYLGGNRLTDQLLKHWQNIFPDPSAVASWLFTDYDTMVQSAVQFKNLLNQRARENLVSEGFLRDPLSSILPINNADIYAPLTSDMKDIEQNPEKYRSLVGYR